MSSVLSAQLVAWVGRGEPVEEADSTGQLTVQTSAGHHELYLSLRTNSTVADFSELKSRILWSTAWKSSRGSSLICIITFSLFFNKWEINRITGLSSCPCVLPAVLRLTEDREGGFVCVFGYNSVFASPHHFPENIPHLSCASILLADSRNNCGFWKTTGAVPVGTFFDCCQALHPLCFAHIFMPCVNCPCKEWALLPW